LRDAKAKLSDVIDTAKREGPQMITLDGVEEAVVVPIGQWRTMTGTAKPTLLEIVRSGPPFDLNIPPRGRMRMRKPVVDLRSPRRCKGLDFGSDFYGFLMPPPIESQTWTFSSRACPRAALVG
jgi:antitoxin Phd